MQCMFHIQAQQCDISISIRARPLRDTVLALGVEITKDVVATRAVVVGRGFASISPIHGISYPLDQSDNTIYLQMVPEERMNDRIDPR